MDATITRHDPQATDDSLLPTGGRYLVGYDGSLASRGALAWAAARAQLGGRDVCLVGVIDEDSGAMGGEFAAGAARETAQMLSVAAERLLEDHPELRVRTALTHGVVASALAGTATSKDLIVIGSDKTGHSGGRVYGSLSLQLAACATTPFAVIPTTEQRLRAGVLAALDDTPRSHDIARLAVREAAARGTRLLLLHAIPLNSGIERRRVAEEVLASALAAVRADNDRVEITTRVALRRTTDAVLDLARDKAMLVIGRSRRSSDTRVGGTLHDVLMNVNARVVVA